MRERSACALSLTHCVAVDRFEQCCCTPACAHDQHTRLCCCCVRANSYWIAIIACSTPKRLFCPCSVSLSSTTTTTRSLKVDNPYTGETFTEVAYDTSAEAHAKLDASVAAQRKWQRVPLSERQELCRKWIDALASSTESIARDISGQMGKPLQQARNEVNGTIARAKCVLCLLTLSLSVLMDGCGNEQSTDGPPA